MNSLKPVGTSIPSAWRRRSWVGFRWADEQSPGRLDAGMGKPASCAEQVASGARRIAPDSPGTL